MTGVLGHASTARSVRYAFGMSTCRWSFYGFPPGAPGWVA